MRATGLFIFCDTTLATIEAQPMENQNTSSANNFIVYRNIVISRRSRIILWFLRLVAKRMLTAMGKANPDHVAKIQLRVSSMECRDSAGLPIHYKIVGNQPGHVIGNLEKTNRPLVLWIHGGAFSLPAAPDMHLSMVAYLCRQLDADGFVPDYRLAPANKFPAGLNDCEQTYRTLLEMGYPPSKILVGGDSAGGTLLLGLLQRIRKAGLPMPACAVPVSPVTELGRVHNPPSRYRIHKSDPLLPIAAMQKMFRDYIGDHDSADPEVSPLYMECEGLPPLFFLASANEILMDDTAMLARRTHEAGIETVCHIWPLLPHAVPLFAATFPEAREARDDIAAFMRKHLGIDS